jgi:catalase
MIGYFSQADEDYGRRVAESLGLSATNNQETAQSA